MRIMLRRFSLFLAVALVAPSACKTSNSASNLRDSVDGEASKREAPNAAAPLFVVMGGYNSCGRDNQGRTTVGMSMFAEFAAFQSRLESAMRKKFDEAADVAVLRTCFEGGNGVILHLRASDQDSDTTQSLSVLTPAADRAAGGSGIANRPDASKLEDFFAPILAEIKRLASTAGSRPVFFIGHSHGGWLAMQTAKRAQAEISMSGLMTLDPISRVHCSPGDYSVLGTSARGCTEFPRDVDVPTRRSLAGVGLWRNFYQVHTANLHSGVADEANDFTKQLVLYGAPNPEPRGWTEGGAHTTVPRELTRVWSKWDEDVARALDVRIVAAPVQNGATTGLSLTSTGRGEFAWSWEAFSAAEKVEYSDVHGAPSFAFPLWQD